MFWNCGLWSVSLLVRIVISNQKHFPNLLTPIFLLLFCFMVGKICFMCHGKDNVLVLKNEGYGFGFWNDIATYSTYIPFYILNPFTTSPVDIIKNVRLYTPTPAQWELDMMFDIDDYIQNMKQPILSEDMNFIICLKTKISCFNLLKCVNYLDRGFLTKTSCIFVYEVSPIVFPH